MMSSKTPDPFANRAFAIQAPLRANGRRRIHDLKICRAIEGLSFPSVAGAVIQAGADLSGHGECFYHGAQRPIGMV
jgi:hypothetical protein